MRRRKMDIWKELNRLLNKTNKFYVDNITSILLIFSIPALLSYIILISFESETFPSLGGTFIRTTSAIYHLPFSALLITAGAYAIVAYLISDAIVNINLLIKRERTYTNIAKDILSGTTTYAIKLFIVSLIIILVLSLFQILTIDLSSRALLYGLLSFLFGLLLFYVPPAIVIDNQSIVSSITYSMRFVGKVYPLIMAIIWTILGLFFVSVVAETFLLILSYPFSEFATILVNAVIVYPYLFILQTHMYMDKYPLTK